MPEFRVWRLITARDRKEAVAKAILENEWTASEICGRYVHSGNYCTMGKEHDGSCGYPEIHDRLEEE